ncbi:discoidin domain-containing protein [uncultured Mediterranea sp.]|uniref:discoidin domain-containing protein n=1 Tax=uncultured Mediterranea sp. TaxID=1926662 RepID=UPI0027D94B63|nr:discoidin domain-containing protein [uncultured Mediterranea sp.]
MKTFEYLSFLFLSLFILSSCEDEYVYNTRVVNSIELVGINEDGGLLFSKGENGEVQIKMLPVDATDKAQYIFAFESGDENIFTVDSVGTIQTITPGKAQLTVRAVNNPAITQTCQVTVQPNWVRTIELPQEYRDCNLLIGNTLDLGSAVTIKPENVDNPQMNYTSSNTDIASVDANGVVTAIAKGDVEIIIQAADGGGAMTSAFIHVTDELMGDFPREAWEITTSHPYVPDKGITGAPEDMLDGSFNTFLSIRKPGKGSETPAGATIFFTVDMKQAYPFNYFRWHHRGDNTTAGLRVSEVEVYGSNDGDTFEEIQKAIPLDVTANASTGEKIVLDKKTSYRYVRFVMTGYDPTDSSAVQISEIYIGNE